MAYKVSGTVSIKDDQTVIFETITATTRRSTFGGFGANATHGYVAGGLPPFAYSNVIEKYSFASDANATDVGNLTENKYGTSGQSSSAHGYASGGSLKSPPAPAGQTNVIEKWSFSSDGDASDVGDLLATNTSGTGQSSTTNGYHSGGYSAASSPTSSNVVQNWPFSSDGNASDVGDLTQGRNQIPAGQSSDANGYTSAGQALIPPYSNTNTIDKFPFSSNANATDVGDITQGKYLVTGQSSADHGYTSGGFAPTLPSPYSNVIDKFSFSSDGNATDVGDLTVARNGIAGSSSGSFGYNAGGSEPYNTDVIEKFPFASDANSADAADLTVNQRRRSGTQG